jgi:hypothetical protein
MATIITDGISEERKSTAKFKDAYQDMLRQLTAPNFAPVLCAHEAAHVVYFRLVGETKYAAFPATIQYDPTIDDYVGHLAAVQVLELPEAIPGKFWGWFNGVALAYAAGGVVSRKLMPSSNGGDQNDKKLLKDLCDLVNEDPNINLNSENVWKAAQSAVIEDLQNPQRMASIETEAAVLRPLLGL